MSDQSKESAKSSAPRKVAPPAAMVIFGANGDLTKRLVVPALYNLCRAGKLADNFVLVGVDRNDSDARVWTQGLKEFLATMLQNAPAGNNQIDEKVWARLTAHATFVVGDITQADTYKHLSEVLADLDGQHQLGGNTLFYLAVGDRFFGPIIDELAAAGLTRQEGEHWRRVIVEKPFGHDLDSAKALNERILKVLDESQVFRMDHFLGKETVQNIMAFRFANGMFEHMWNRDRIDHVQVTAAETVGVEKRGSFYEVTGALRDMVPNHVFQLIAMVAMEPPVSFAADDVRNKKADVFSAMHPVKAENVCRGQYGAGKIGDAEVPGYREEPNVAPDSNTETYVAMKLEIDNWRWAGVPFYVRTGKRLSKRWTEIALRFKAAPYALFKDAPVEELGANWLIIQIQPDEGIRLHFSAKQPGTRMELDTVSMDFKYADWFQQAPANGYETLIFDCLIGDATLFQRADQVEGAWRVVQPALDLWSTRKPSGFPDYAAGSDGPSCSDALLQRDGRAWRKIG
jgi:glucose-6-phosphate 1-dehydrogenase